MWFNQYPYLNLNDLNLDFILKAIRDMKYEVENFVSINAIKYADPIQWSITSQYEKNTVVIDPVSGTAYISVAPVPAGVALTRPEYWTVVFDLQSFVTKANQNLANNYEAATTTTATMNTNAGEWVVWGDVLYRALVNITAGDAYVIGSNIERITIEDVIAAILNDIATEVQNRIDADDAINAIIGDLDNLTTSDKTSIVNAINEVKGDINALSDITVYVTPEQFGAVGDGVTDDTQAFIDALAENKPFLAAKTYKLTAPITIRGADGAGFPKILINSVISSASVAFILCNENVDFEIGFLSADGVGIQFGDGVNDGLAVSTIKIGYMIADIPLKSLPSPTKNVQDININGGVCIYKTNGFLMDNTNRWTGEVTINDMWFRTYDGTGGYAITADCSAHGITGMNLNSVSFEGANGGIEALNTNAGGTECEFAPIKAFGLRVSEMNLNNGYPVIKQTGNGRLYGELFVDKMNASGVDIAQQAVTASNQSPLTIYGRIIKGTKTYNKAILVNNKLAVDVENNKGTLGVSGALSDSDMPTHLSRVTADTTLTLKEPFNGKLLFLVETSGVKVTVNGNAITAAENYALITVECFYFPNVGLRYLVRYKDTNTLVVPAP